MSQKVSKYFFYLVSVCYATEGLVEVLVGSAWPLIAKSVGADISLIGFFVAPLIPLLNLHLKGSVELFFVILMSTLYFLLR